jgi:death-on-curing protein
VAIEWLNENLVRTFHQEQLNEHGGLAGPGSGSVEATLCRPLNILAYGDPDASLAKLAAAYGFGFARNHCFADANKRVALVSMDVFLQFNGRELVVPEPEAVAVLTAVAAGTMTEAELETWVEQHQVPL